MPLLLSSGSGKPNVVLMNARSLRRSQGGFVHLGERTPRERVPQMAPGHATTQEVHRDARVPDAEREEIAGLVPFLQEQRGGVQEDIGFGVPARHPKAVVLLAGADVDE